MIDVADVLRGVPHFEHFCSVAELRVLIDTLGDDAGFDVTVAGASVKGVPIHHVRFGKGSVKALVVGFPHCHEPIGGLTIYSLITLLRQRRRALIDADVAWHIVPCIDPDGAILNEGWTQQPFSIANYIREYYLQPRPHQVDFSFPISHGTLVFDQPSPEALVLKGILDHVRPDVFFSLHNHVAAGGAWYVLSHDLGSETYAQIGDLLGRNNITLVPDRPGDPAQFSRGIRRAPTIKEHYDHLVRQGIAIPAEYAQGRLGASSLEYLAAIKPDAVALVAELTYGRHRHDVSSALTGQDLRQLKLRIFAENKFIVAAILEEWAKVEPDLDTTSPFYRKIRDDLIDTRESAPDGVTAWYEPSLRTLMFNAADARPATERDRVDVYAMRTAFLGNAHVFMRLLNQSRQTAPVRRAAERLGAIFDAAIADTESVLGSPYFNVIDCDTLAKAQLGSGLIALNAVLARASS